MSYPSQHGMARRTSYASVLSGAASSNPQPTRSGFLSGSHGASSYHPLSNTGPRSSDVSRAYDNGQRLPESLNRDAFPSYPGKWSDGPAGAMIEPRTFAFFIPSYLRASRHVDRLEEKYKARERTQREGRSARSSIGGSMSRSGSGVNLQKMVPSHRGMTYEIQEKFAPNQEDVVAPLPTRWSSHDKCQVLEVSADGVEVKFTGQFKNGTQDDAGTIRTDHPVPPACGIYYFEITILGRAKEGFCGMGFVSHTAGLNRLPGWEPDCYAYHGDDGFKFGGGSTGSAYGPKYSHQDIIGCGIDFRTGSIFFTKNGVHNGIAFKDVKADKLFPAVGLKKAGEYVKVNFGQEPFAFDIDGMVENERETIRTAIDAEDATVLHPSGASESQLMQELIGQYLAHEGYTETTKAFADEVKQTITYLKGPEAAESSSIVYKEDPDAVKRQKIRSAVLEGNVQHAIDLTDQFYANVLPANENIYFKLRCRKFIELIKKSTELQPHPKHRRSSSAILGRRGKGSVASIGTNGHARDSHEDFGRMEVDNENGQYDVAGGAISDDVYTQQSTLMNEALMYGRKLQNEFKDDPRREVKQALEDTFALIAYPDARESSLAYLLEESHRVPVAEELNSAILISLGQSSTAALEKLVNQTEVMMTDISADGGGAALLHLNKHFLR